MVGPISFSGPVSGIDYTSIINKMLDLQRQPETQLKNQIQNATDKKNALLELNISLLAFKQSADILRRPSFFANAQAASNNDSLLSASAGTGAVPGTYTFTVQQLAQSHQLLSNGFADATITPVAAAAGSISIAVGSGSPVVVSIAAGAKLQDVADAINAQSPDVSAAIIHDGSSGTPYHLALTSRKSGLAGQLTIDASSIPALSFITTAAAQDAVVLSGSSSGGGTPAVLTSSTNTVSGAVPGLTLTLKGTSAAPVTVTVSRDTKGIGDQVQRFVDAYNDVIQKIKEDTAFDPSTFKAGILFGDFTVNSLQRELSRLVIDPVQGIPSSQLNTATSLGIRLGDQGALGLDRGLLDQKLESSFDQVRTFFTKARQLDIATSIKDFTGGAGLSLDPGADLRVLAKDGTAIDVELSGAMTLGDVLLAINNAAGNGGKVTARIASNGFALELLDSTGASANPLQVLNLGVSLAASQLKISKTAAASVTLLSGDVLALSGSPGFAARMSNRLDGITGFAGGLITVQTANLDKTVEALNKSIERIEERVSHVQENLVRRFTALEQVIARSQSTQQRLSQLLSSLTGNGN